jgi:hypothetical protein
MFLCWPFCFFTFINLSALINLFASMVCRRVLLVLFFTFNVVFNEPFYFNALISFNESFNIYVLINFYDLVNLSTLMVKCGALRFCIALIFYYVFSTLS